MATVDYPGSFRDDNDVPWSLSRRDSRYSAVYEPPTGDHLVNTGDFDTLPELLRAIATIIENDYRVDVAPPTCLAP